MNKTKFLKCTGTIYQAMAKVEKGAWQKLHDLFAKEAAADDADPDLKWFITNFDMLIELIRIQRNGYVWKPDFESPLDAITQKAVIKLKIAQLRTFIKSHKLLSYDLGDPTDGNPIVILAAINEEDPNDVLWTDIRRLIRHDPDPEYLRPYILQKYASYDEDGNCRYDGLSARILQVIKDGADHQKMARIAYAMYEKRMNRKMAWRQWYKIFCYAFAIDVIDRYRENPQDLCKDNDAYQKAIEEIYPYLPKRSSGTDITRKAKRVKAKPVDEYIDQDQYENDLYNGKI